MANTRRTTIQDDIEDVASTYGSPILIHSFAIYPYSDIFITGRRTLNPIVDPTVQSVIMDCEPGSSLLFTLLSYIYSLIFCCSEHGFGPIQS